MKKMPTLICLMTLLISTHAWGTTYTVCSSGCDETNVETVMSNNDLAPGDIIQLTESITEADSIEWGGNDDGDSNDDIVLDLNGYTLAITTAAYGMLIDDTDYVTVQNGTITADGAADEEYIVRAQG